MVDGIWTHFAVWGVPVTTETVTVGLDNGTTVELDNGTTVELNAQNGVALHPWEESVGITSFEFAGMTQSQRDIIESTMPAQGIGSDCGRSNDGGG